MTCPGYDGRVAQMRSVDSSAVEAVGYDADTRTLYVRYADGDTYAYDDVPPDVHRWLLRSDSIGGYLNRVVKPAYAGREV